ncbi:hypothetical protein [Tomitella biformata]|uniref:hypothetical protein n=1 Tax=Tomitella biformata TaxID=630403 RepID=UPI0011DD84AF|nr:hypothetical protein [Tomitella biformata]
MTTTGGFGDTVIAVPSMPQTDSATNGTGMYPWQVDLYPPGTPKVEASATELTLEAIAATEAELSWGSVPELDADVLWAIPDTADQMSEFTGNGLWNGLAAVQRGSRAEDRGRPLCAGFFVSAEPGVGREPARAANV